MSLESNIITGTPRMQTAEKHKQPFHMDGKKIVCNVCGEHFTNLVLFGNHTHGTDRKASIMPSDKSCPKSDHKTFNTMSEDEMIEAFHKMPELEGCWINNGRYICNMCGKSCPNPYVLFSHKIIHPEDMTPMVKGKETDSQQTLGVATQTKIEMGYRNRNRKLDKNIRIDSDDDDSESGDAAAAADDDNESGDAAAAADDDDNVQKPMHLMRRPVKKLKEMNTGNSNAKSPKTLQYKNLISYDRGSTFLKSKSIAKEPGKKSKPGTGGDRRTGLRLSSDSEDEVYDSTPITSDDDVNGDNSLNLQGRPSQNLDSTKYKKKETNVYRSLIAVKGWTFVKAKKPPFEYCGNMFGHNFLDKCKIFNGRYYCDECPRLYSSPYLLLNHKLYHAKCKCLTQRRHALNGTTHKSEESHEDTTDEVEEVEEAQVSTTDKMEELHEDTTDQEEESHEDTIDEEEEDSMCFECNLCQVKFDTTDGLADHIEAHAADTQAGASCTLSESALADISKASTSARSTEMVDDTIAVKIKKEPVTDYVGYTLEPQLEPSGLDPSVRIKQEPEPSNLPQHSIEDRMRTGEVDVPFEDKLILERSMLNPVVRLKRNKIIHPEDMTLMVKGKETDSQQTLGVATQTKIELGYGNSNRKLDKNIRIDSDDDDSERGDAAAADDDNESGDAAAAAADDDNVQKPMHLMRRPVKKLKEMNTGNSNAKSQKTLLYTTLISYDRGSTFLKSKSIAKESGKKSKPATGGDRRTGLRLSSDSEDEVYDSTPITSDDDVDGDNSLNLQGRPSQNLDSTKYKKKETNEYRSLIAVKGQSCVKAKKPPFEYCGNMFGHNFLDKCKILNGRYYCDECPRLYSSPYLLWNHKLYHAKCKCLTQRRHALNGTTHKSEESHEDTTDEVEEAQVSSTDKMEETHEGTTDEEEAVQVSTTDKMEETHEGTPDEEEEDSMCFECNLCQVKFDTTDGLADHIEAHAADTQAGASCTLSESALADISKASTSACSTEMVDDTIAVKVKKEPDTDYVGDTLEPLLESSGLDQSVRIKQEPEPSNLPQHSIEDRMRTGEVDVPFEDKLFLKRSMLNPVVRLKRIKIEPNDVYIMK